MCFGPVSRHGSLTAKFTFHSEVSVVAGFTEDMGMFLSNSVVRSPVFGYAPRKAPPECNLALQYKLNDHIFPEEKGYAIVPYQQSCCKPFYESKPRIMVLPTDNCSITLFFFVFFFNMDPGVRCSQSKHLSEKHTADTAIKPLLFCFGTFEKLFCFLFLFLSFFFPFNQKSSQSHPRV